MKKIFFFFLGLLFFTGMSAQVADSSRQQASDLLRKANKQNTAGWIILGGGAGLAAAGLIIGVATVWPSIIEGDNTGTDIGGAMIVTGLAGMVGSIPVFIASGKNRKKAATMVLIKMENSSYMNQYTMAEKRYPAVAFNVRF